MRRFRQREEASHIGKMIAGTLQGLKSSYSVTK
jgi:hypothetical protein